MPSFLEDVFHIPKDTTRSHLLATAAAEHRFCRLKDLRLISFSFSFFIATTFSSTAFTLGKFDLRTSVDIGVFLVSLFGPFSSFFFGRHWFGPMVGRIIEGFGAGLLIPAVPSYLADIAGPSQIVLVICFVQASYKFAALLANSFTYLMIEMVEEDSQLSGWVLSLCLPVLLRVVFLGRKSVLPDTIPRGAGGSASDDTTSLWQKKYAPMIIAGSLLPLFKNLTGFNVIGPIVFQAIGFDSEKALVIEIVRCVVGFLIAPAIAVFCMDKMGRRRSFVVGSIVMVTGLLLFGFLKVKGHNALWSAMLAAAVYELGFGISWGLQVTLTLSEMYPPEIRRQGLGMSTTLDMFFSALMNGASLWLLCWLKYKIFFVFAVMVPIGTLFKLLVPDMRGIHLHGVMENTWRRHWFWKIFYAEEPVNDVEMGPRGSDDQPPSSWKDDQADGVIM